jgi:hypothetical protein
MINFLDIVHHHNFYFKQHSRDWILSLSSGKSSVVVTISTTCVNIKTLNFSHGVYLCVSYDFQHKQRLFPYTALIIGLCNGDAACFL